MKLSKFKQLIKEEIELQSEQRNATLKEGVVDKIIAAIVDKIVKVKYKKYFDELHKDPEYIEALKGIKTYAQKMDASAEAWEQAKIKSDKSYNEYAKRYGKEAADRIVADVKAGTYKASWKKKY
jgi:hypothetical protein